MNKIRKIKSKLDREIDNYLKKPILSEKQLLQEIEDNYLMFDNKKVMKLDIIKQKILNQFQKGNIKTEEDVWKQMEKILKF